MAVALIPRPHFSLADGLWIALLSHESLEESFDRLAPPPGREHQDLMTDEAVDGGTRGGDRLESGFFTQEGLERDAIEVFARNADDRIVRELHPMVALPKEQRSHHEQREESRHDDPARTLRTTRGR